MKLTGNFPRRLKPSPLRSLLLYRRPMAVSEIHVFPRCQNAPAYPVCPRCGKTMEREYMAFCSRCGQMLDWQSYDRAKVVYVEPDHGAVSEENPARSR